MRSSSPLASTELKANLRVAEGIDGFHPKAVFWKDMNDNRFALVGSSNLTRAAFDSNYEANIRSTLSDGDYAAVLAWVKRIGDESVGVAEWPPTYKEARLVGKRGSGHKGKSTALKTTSSLPSPPSIYLGHLGCKSKLRNVAGSCEDMLLGGMGS